MIKFSITIPAFKALYLSEAIESCLSQTYQNYEVIIVDDASPEDLKSVVKPYLKDSRIRFYRNETNCGAVNVVDNWNICLGHCTGDYVICMGDDDRLIPNCLEDYAKLMERYPKLGVYHSQTELIDEKGNFFDMQQPRPEWESALSLVWNRWNGRNRQYIGDFCFNTAQLRANGGFYKLPLAWASDDITAIIAAEKSGIANTSKIGFQYRVNRYTISKTGNVRQKLEAVILERRWYEEFLSQYNPISEQDCKFLKLIKYQLPEHFRLKIKSMVMEDTMLKTGNIIDWMTNRRHNGLSIGDIIDAWLTGIKRSLR